MASSEENNNLCRMQQLIDEMDKSNQRIDLFNEKFDTDGLNRDVAPRTASSLEHNFDALLDEPCRSEESDVASFQGIPANHVPKDLEDSGCEEVINSAIAEVSKDFLAGLQTSGTQIAYGDSDESHISSDSDFKLIGGMPSYARYPETAAGLSDTDWNPYGTESDNNQSPHLQSAQSIVKELKSASAAMTPFRPVLHSTDLCTITPNSDDKIMSINSHSHLSDIREITERDSRLQAELIPDSSAQESRIFQKANWAISPMKMYPNKNDPPLYYNRETTKFVKLPDEVEAKNTRKDDINIKESASSDEEKKMLASTSSTGYSSGASGVKINSEVNKGKASQDYSQPQHMSVFERAKLMGIPEDILFDKSSRNHPHLTKERRSHSEKTPCGGLSDYDSDDHLGKKVQHILSETAHLSRGAEKMNQNKAAIDYNMLQKDLQEIQDNLESLSSNSPAERIQDWKKNTENSPLSSDKDGDIPSQSSTPEKNGQNSMWDFTEMFGPLANRVHRNRSFQHRPGIKKINLNSDGDETRSSDSSQKSEDHNMSLSEKQETFQSNLKDLHTSHDVDQMLSTFRDQRHQLESRYEQLNNQGLAEKVFRILTNQDPESQANGILSEISAEEKEMKSKLAVKKHQRDFNFSSNSSLLEDSHRSFLGLPDDVRKKLDLSGLSSVDSSRAFEKSSFSIPPSSKGFSAFDDAKRFLSSQMAKVSERTFNHSLEMNYPQSIQCYPLFMDKSDKEEGGRPDTLNTESKEEATSGDEKKENGSSEPLKDKSDTSQELPEGERRPSPNNSDPGSSSRPKEKYRPYRPPGSKEVYYTESDTASVADSVTTIESTHVGSDDAAGPHLPQSAYGSRKDAPNVAGIYGTRKNLSTVQEGQEPSSTEERPRQVDEGYKSSQTLQTEGSSTTSRTRPHGISTQDNFDNTRHGQSVTTQCYTTSIWAKKEEHANNAPTERKDGRLNQSTDSASLSHGKPTPVSHSISAARRDARWANRTDEKNQDLSDTTKSRSQATLPVEGNIQSQRPSQFNEREFVDAARKERDHADIKENFALPTNAFVSEGLNFQEEGEKEPMSLRIKLAYTDSHQMHDRNRKRIDLPENVHAQQRSHFADDSFDFRTRDVGRYQQRSYSPSRHNLIRSASDENLNSSRRDARLSPAFRRALSPELLYSIGSRSPLLGRTIEKSLAQPPSEYPSQYIRNHRPFSPNDPPTFLARERSFSPREYAKSPVNDYITGQGPSIRVRSSPMSLERTSPVHDVRPRAYQTSPVRRQQTPERRQIENERPAHRQTSPNPLPRRNVELTLEGMTSESEADTEIDRQPISRRAQLLKDALSHEKEPSINPDINAMWEQFKAYNESDDSSINTARMEAVADLLKNPSTHFVSQYLQEREEYRIERQERVEREKEKRIKEQVRAHKSSSSEDDFNGRYQELLAAKEEERFKRRSSKKKKGKNGVSTKGPEIAGVEKRQTNKGPDSLYSIPEDRSFDQSPGKSSSKPKSRAQVAGQPNIIDPNMLKLREKISKQRVRVDKNMMKEMMKIEKLKKLQRLLKAKDRGEITNQMLEQQLEELSTTSHTISDNSQENVKPVESKPEFLSDDSTTAKDSSGEMHVWKMMKEKRLKDLENALDQGNDLYMKNGNNNKENKIKNSTSKDLQRHSEIKLLKLVKEGHLTADEAYTLALARTRQAKSMFSGNLSDTSSDNDASLSSQRPHRFYSPYSRSSVHMSETRHVPKLKFSDKHTDISINSTDDWRERRQKHAWGHERYDEYSKFNHDPLLLSKLSVGREQRRRTNNAKYVITAPAHGKYERGRPRSQSPCNSTRHRHARQRKVGPHGHQSPLRSHSSSPSRWMKDNFFLPSKGKCQSSPNPSLSKKGVAWNIDMDSPPDQWREPQPEPLQEISSSGLNKPRRPRHFVSSSEVEMKANLIQEKQNRNENDIWRKSYHPHGIPKQEWEKVVSQDKLASKTNHWQVDPIMDKVQYILNKPTSSALSDQSSFTSQRKNECLKSSSKLSLQEAFLHKKQDFISKCRERQKRLNLAKDERQMQECLRLEREAIFAEQERLGFANVYAHPYSDNLYQPKRRVLTKQEMKEMTARKYKNLPEVIEKKEEDKRKIEYKLNRLRANLFNKKVQKEVLKKRYKQRG